MKKILSVIAFLIITLFVALNTNAQACYDVYNQRDDRGNLTGYIVYYSSCDEPIKIALAYSVYESNGEYLYTTADYSILGRATKEHPKPISIDGYQVNGYRFKLIRYINCNTNDGCEKFIESYTKQR